MNEMKVVITLTLLCFEQLLDPTRVSVSISGFLLKSKNESIGVSESSNSINKGKYHTGSKCLLLAILSSSHLLPPLPVWPHPCFGLSFFCLPSVDSPIPLPLDSPLACLSSYLLPACVCQCPPHFWPPFFPAQMPAPCPCLSLAVVMSVPMWLSQFAAMKQHCSHGLNSTYLVFHICRSDVCISFPWIKKYLFFSGVLGANHFLPSSSFYIFVLKAK